jgi:poly(A) polymerase/tRNA nucleotidyltransferase (CCA-adding enzyme)
VSLAPWQRDIVAAAELYRVGGAVRDRLLGVRDVVDADFLVRGLPPAELEAVLSRHGAWARVGKAFGVYKFTPREGGGTVDVVLPRTESSTGVGHRDFDVATDWRLPVEADLARRDFTINAIAERLPDGPVVDPFHGAHDVERRVLRMIFPRAFEEDPLRVVRGARFAARFALSIDPATEEAMAAAAALLASVSAERMQDEFTKTLVQCEQPSRAFHILHQGGSLGAWLPELERCAGVTQNEFHPDDVYGHSLKTCDAAPADRLVVRWAALLHDTGKVDARRVLVEGGVSRVVFYGHEIKSAEHAEAALARLRYPRDFVQACRHLVREHMYRYESAWSAATVRRFMRRAGEDSLDDLLALREADCRSRGLDAELARLDELRARIGEERRSASTLTVKKLAIDGRDVMREIGIPPGRAVGDALEYLLERVLDSPALNTREQLLALVRTESSRWVSAAGRANKSRKPA